MPKSIRLDNKWNAAIEDVIAAGWIRERKKRSKTELVKLAWDEFLENHPEMTKQVAE